MKIENMKNTPSKVANSSSVLPKMVQSAQTVENSHSFFNIFYTWYKSSTRTNPKLKIVNRKSPFKEIPFEWVPSQLSRFLTDSTLAKLLEHPGQ